MKKIFAILGLLVTLLIITSCSKDTNSSVVISKIITSNRTANNIIELYNNSDSDENLSSYKLNFYQNGSEKITNYISLKGTIPANDYFVVSGENFDVSSYQDIVDFSHNDGSLPFNGNDVIELSKNNKRIDLIGHIGIDLDFSKDLTLIRIGLKENYVPYDTYDEFNFIPYSTNLFKYLKNDNHEIKTLDDLYNGPRLEERYINELPYKDPESDNAGAGGTFLATLSSIADGDTATFKPIQGENYEGYNPSGSLRYYYIDTPEVQGNMEAEPWGYVASKYNKQFLLINSASKELRIQSIPGYSLTETYSRNLGLIWINGHLSQFLIVAEGLSDDVP